MKRGIVFSLSVLLVFSTMLLFAVFYLQKVQREETTILENFALEKAGFVADDIVTDFNLLLGTRADANRTQTITTVSFFDQLPPKTSKTEISDFNSFVFNTYSKQQNAQITMNIDKLVDGKTEMIFSNGLQYDYDYSGAQNSVQLYKPGNDTGVTEFDVNVFVAGAQYDSANSVPWGCAASGVQVNLRFEDGFGNVVESNCEHDPGIFYEYVFALAGETETLAVSAGTLGPNPNALKVKSTLLNPAIVTTTAIKAVFPSPAQELSGHYDADLNYSQGDVNLNRKIEILRS